MSLIAFFYWIFILFLNRTLRVRIEGDQAWKSHPGVIFALWHQQTFVPFFIYRHRGIVMFVMESQRGQVLGWCARRLGFQTITMPNDTSSYANAKGVARFLRELKKGANGMIAVDGPLGPGNVVKPGIFYLSRSSGTPIVPCRVEMSACLTLRSRWDHYQLPLPFSRVTVRFSAPYFPEGEDATEVQRLTELLR
jgi:lysophospholipid acyltransferase (LPLAT)-like uncharacterized protein